MYALLHKNIHKKRETEKDRQNMDFERGPRTKIKREGKKEQKDIPSVVIR